MPKWLETALAILGASSIVSCFLWFWRKPKLRVELEHNEDHPEEFIGEIYNDPIKNKFARKFHIQRKAAEHVLVHFLIRDHERIVIPDQDNVWVQATVITGQGFPSARVTIPPSIAGGYFTIGRIHPDSKSFHVEENGILKPGKYVVVIQVEDDGVLRHAARQLNVTAWPPYAFWVGQTTPLQKL